jgi:hypothetical protein
MFGIQNLLKAIKRESAPETPVFCMPMASDLEKPGESSADEYYTFEKDIFELKNNTIRAIIEVDKDLSIIYLKRISTMCSKAVYGRNLRQIIAIDDAVCDIKKALDARLELLYEPDDLMDDFDETKKYMVTRINLIPINSMLYAIKFHSAAAIAEANGEIDLKIQEAQKFLVDYETNVARI